MQTLDPYTDIALNMQYYLDNINDSIFNSLTWYIALSISENKNLEYTAYNLLMKNN